MQELYYVYPIWQRGSFHNIAREHIKHLKAKISVQEVDEQVLDNIMWVGDKSILLHPIGYLLLGDRWEQFPHRIKRLYKLLNVSKKLGGFDTADSSRISKTFVNVLNHLDLVFVPSNWAKECYENSGVETDVQVLPHGLPDEFLAPLSTPISSKLKNIESETIRKLTELKRKHKARFVLFFLMHSGFRKGADLVARAMQEVQKEFPRAYLVVKSGEILDPYMSQFGKLKMINVKGWLSIKELRQLYDLCDIVVCPSRGGGFELNALEGIARGKPVIVPNAMCFLDYAKYCVTVEIAKEIEVLPGNPLHIGKGYEISLNDFINQIKRVLTYYDNFKRRARKDSEKVRKEYAWSKICEKLYDILNDYGFLGG